MHSMRLAVLSIPLLVWAGACSSDDEVAATTSTTEATVVDAGVVPTTAEDPAALADRGYVGTVEGTDAFVAVLGGGDEAMVYVCDGDAELAELFSGATPDPARVELTSAGGATVDAVVEGGVVTGTFTDAAGTAHALTATPAPEGGGFFRVLGAEAEADGVTAGWIRDGLGGERGAIRRRGTFVPTTSFSSGRFSLGTSSYPVYVVKVPSPPAPLVPTPYPITGVATK